MSKKIYNFNLALERGKKKSEKNLKKGGTSFTKNKEKSFKNIPMYCLKTDFVFNFFFFLPDTMQFIFL